MYGLAYRQLHNLQKMVISLRLPIFLLLRKSTIIPQSIKIPFEHSVFLSKSTNLYNSQLWTLKFKINRPKAILASFKISGNRWTFSTPSVKIILSSLVCTVQWQLVGKWTGDSHCWGVQGSSPGKCLHLTSN